MEANRPMKDTTWKSEREKGTLMPSKHRCRVTEHRRFAFGGEASTLWERCYGRRPW